MSESQGQPGLCSEVQDSQSYCIKKPCLEKQRSTTKNPRKPNWLPNSIGANTRCSLNIYVSWLLLCCLCEYVQTHAMVMWRSYNSSWGFGSPSAVWVPGFELRSLVWQQSSLLAEPSLWPAYFVLLRQDLVYARLTLNST